MEKPPPFTKRALKNLCGKITRVWAEDDVRKLWRFSQIWLDEIHISHTEFRQTKMVG